MRAFNDPTAVRTSGAGKKHSPAVRVHRPLCSRVSTLLHPFSALLLSVSPAHSAVLIFLFFSLHSCLELPVAARLASDKPLVRAQTARHQAVHLDFLSPLEVSTDRTELSSPRPLRLLRPLSALSATRLPRPALSCL